VPASNLVGLFTAARREADLWHVEMVQPQGSSGPFVQAAGECRGPVGKDVLRLTGSTRRNSLRLVKAVMLLSRACTTGSRRLPFRLMIVASYLLFRTRMIHTHRYD